jgi:nuclear pore complex protein Nup98-Nup96
LLDRLTIALPGLLEGRTGKVDLEERVAVGEMAGLVKAEVEKMGREEKGVDRNLVNRLPVAGGKYAKQGVDLSRAYYRAIVA